LAVAINPKNGQVSSNRPKKGQEATIRKQRKKLQAENKKGKGVWIGKKLRGEEKPGDLAWGKMERAEARKALRRGERKGDAKKKGGGVVAGVKRKGKGQKKGKGDDQTTTRTS